jgi:hypothetical protein|tara:strand:+ start:125 stop:295 length:171 start_codon:yes stop_codon:yes gene_type:complete
LGQLFECLNPDAYKKRQPIFKSKEGDFGDVEMKLTANRRVVLDEHNAMDRNNSYEL